MILVVPYHKINTNSLIVSHSLTAESGDRRSQILMTQSSPPESTTWGHGETVKVITLLYNTVQFITVQFGDLQYRTVMAIWY